MDDAWLSCPCSQEETDGKQDATKASHEHSCLGYGSSGSCNLGLVDLFLREWVGDDSNGTADD